LRVAVRLQSRENASLGFASPRTVSLALRVPGRSEVVIQVLDVGPPATMADGRILVPPNRDEAVIEFELEGDEDGKVRVEVYHPDAVEDVTSKVVEGFFDVARNRRLTRATATVELARVEQATAGEPSRVEPTRGEAGAESPAATTATSKHPPSRATAWAELIADEGFQRAFTIIKERRSIDETELQQVLGSPRRVRAFSRSFDELRLLVPFEIEIIPVNGLKTYVRKD
jgi:hypothetical protein